MFVLDMQSRVPIYEQMKRKITELILLGVMSEGEQLPSVRSLARDLGVNPNTVQKAYQELEREGVLYSISGKGSFVAARGERQDALAAQAEQRLREALRRARISGVKRERAKECVNEIYEEAMTE